MNPNGEQSELMQVLQGQAEPPSFEAASPIQALTEQGDLGQMLAALGGLASSHALAVKIHPRPRIRSLRDRLKSREDIRKLGGGYYALKEHPAPQLVDWLIRWMGEQRLPKEQVIDAIEEAWPHGHRPSIRAWLHQDPGAIRVSQGEVWVFRSTRASS